jgi:hypothetical protein
MTHQRGRRCWISASRSLAVSVLGVLGEVSSGILRVEVGDSYKEADTEGAWLKVVSFARIRSEGTSSV